MPAPTPKPTFLAAIKELWRVTTGLGVADAVPLYLDMEPEKIGYPRGIMRDGGEGPVVVGEYNKDSDGIPRPTNTEAFVTLEFYAENDSDAAQALAVLWMTACVPDSIKLTFDTSNRARIFRLPRTFVTTLVQNRSRETKPVYMSSVQYRAMFSTPY